jgi:hypothetical protein
MINEPPTLIRQLYLSAVLSLWDKGMDTYQIAKTLNDDQANVERGLHEALSIRRKDAQGTENRRH